MRGTRVKTYIYIYIYIYKKRNIETHSEKKQRDRGGPGGGRCAVPGRWAPAVESGGAWCTQIMG